MFQKCRGVAAMVRARAGVIKPKNPCRGYSLGKNKMTGYQVFRYQKTLLIRVLASQVDRSETAPLHSSNDVWTYPKNRTVVEGIVARR
jgi:hypothetical protein